MDFKQEKNFLTKIIIYLTFFSLGFLISYIYIDYKAKNHIFSSYKESEKPLNNELNLDKLFMVYDKLKENYYDFKDVNINDLEEKAISGLVNGIGDPHTEYFNKKENEDFEDMLSGDFQGIGAVLEKNDLGVKITNILDNSPAKKEDIRVGDIILEVNGKDISKMSTLEVVKLIKGPSGKEVNLIIKRQDNILNKKLFTSEVVIPSIIGKNFDNDIGYIGISTFGEKTYIDFKKELNNFKDKKGIIIDLRQNGGGYLKIATDILSSFIKKGDILVITKFKDGVVDKYRSSGSDYIYNGKIVILIDSGSASASEIVAGAMKDYSKAILVGEKTYGKGSVQDPIELFDGSMVKITTAKWFTPKDKNIDKEGIKPDIKVEIKEEDIEKKYDRQLEEAKKVLKSFIENNYLQLSIDKYKENNKKS